jgi:hypothetical protein
MMVQGWSEQFDLHRAGLADSSGWEAQTLTIRWYVEQRGVRQWWPNWRRIFAPGFRDFMDGMVREGEAAG